MPRCRTVRENLTAWVDGELSDRWQQRIDSHLRRCSVCEHDARALQHSVDQQRLLLRQVMATPTSDVHALLGGVRQAIAAGSMSDAVPASWAGPRARHWFLRPLPLALAAAMVLTITLTEMAGGPDDVLVPLGVKAPPVAVTKKPAMFRDYAIIEQLEVLENFDTVVIEPLDDSQAFERG